MKNKIQNAFTILLIIIVAAGLYLSRNWNSTTALFPRVVGFPMLALLIVILAVDINKSRRHDRKDIANAIESEIAFTTTNGRMIMYFGWLIGLTVLIWAIGIVYSIPIYIFTYMKIAGKTSWLKSAIYAMAMIAFIVILFGYVFRVAWPEGALLRILNM